MPGRAALHCWFAVQFVKVLDTRCLDFDRGAAKRHSRTKDAIPNDILISAAILVPGTQRGRDGNALFLHQISY